jgi:hypothetical protein
MCDGWFAPAYGDLGLLFVVISKFLDYLRWSWARSMRPMIDDRRIGEGGIKVSHGVDVVHPVRRFFPRNATGN